MNITCEFCGSYIDTDMIGNRCPVCRNTINLRTQVQKIRREMEEKEKTQPKKLIGNITDDYMYVDAVDAMTYAAAAKEKMDKKEDAVTEELFLIPSRNSGRNMVKRMLNDMFGIGGDNMNTNYSDMYKKGSLFGMNGLRIKNVIFNEPATVVYWDDGDKTVVKCGKGEQYDPEKGLAMAISKKALGNRGNYFNEFKKWLPKGTKDATEYISLKDFAESKNLKADSVRKAIKAGAYPEAKKIKGKWYLPATLDKEG